MCIYIYAYIYIISASDRFSGTPLAAAARNGPALDVAQTLLKKSVGFP